MFRPAFILVKNITNNSITHHPLGGIYHLSHLPIGGTAYFWNQIGEKHQKSADPRFELRKSALLPEAGFCPQYI